MEKSFSTGIKEINTETDCSSLSTALSEGEAKIEATLYRFISDIEFDIWPNYWG